MPDSISSGAIGREIVPQTLPDQRAQSPSGVALDSDGTLYVADNGLDRLFAFDANGQLKWSLGGPGYEVGHFQGTGAVAVDTKLGYVYVADPGNHRVDIIDRDGYPVSQFPRASQVPVNLERPEGLTLGSDGSLFVVDAGADRLVKMNSRGDFVGALRERQIAFLPAL